jgi:hypothetical protein
MTDPPAAPEPSAAERDPFASILEGIADARVDDAAAARERAGWVARRAEEDSTFAGALVDLAERQSVVRLQLRGGREIVGTPLAVGPDVVALATLAGRTFVRLGHLAAIRSGPGQGLVPSGPRRAATHAGTRTLHDVVCDATAERANVQLVFDDGREAVGTLRAMGVDVLTLRENNAAQSTVLVSFDAVAAVILLTDR